MDDKHHLMNLLYLLIGEVEKKPLLWMKPANLFIHSKNLAWKQIHEKIVNEAKPYIKHELSVRRIRNWWRQLQCGFYLACTVQNYEEMFQRELCFLLKRENPEAIPPSVTKRVESFKTLPKITIKRFTQEFVKNEFTSIFPSRMLIDQIRTAVYQKEQAEPPITVELDSSLNVANQPNQTIVYQTENEEIHVEADPSCEDDEPVDFVAVSEPSPVHGSSNFLGMNVSNSEPIEIRFHNMIKNEQAYFNYLKLILDEVPPSYILDARLHILNSLEQFKRGGLQRGPSMPRYSIVKHYID